MKKDMFRTTLTRTLMGLINLLFYVYIARTFGSAFVGKVSLTILHISIAALASGVLGGSSLVYLVPQSKKPENLISLSWLGTLIMPTVTIAILLAIGVVSLNVMLVLLFLVALNIAFQNYMNILLAFEKIWLQNLLSILQLLFFVLLFMLGYNYLVRTGFQLDPYSIFVISLGTSYVISTSIAVVHVHRKIPLGKITWDDIKQFVFYAFKTQLASLFGLLTYRTVYFFTEKHVGLSAVGFLSVGFQLGEALWILARSIALVQYSKIANMKSLRQALSVTIVLAVFTTTLTILGGMVLLIVPEHFFTVLLGKDFTNIKHIFVIMLPGFAFMACSMIFVHYHSGSGKIERNLITSLSSFLFVLLLSFFFMPIYPSWFTAAIITTSAYAIHWLISFSFFLLDARTHHFSWKEGVNFVFLKKM